MDRFSKFHPAVCLLFFIFVMLVTALAADPVRCGVSLAAAALWSFRVLGARGAAKRLAFALPAVPLAAVFNMLFGRYGETRLFSLFGAPFTLEALAAGAATGLMLAALMLWFALYSAVLPSEKFTAVFGRFAPGTVLTLSCALGFLPQMAQTARLIKEAQQGLGEPVSGLKNTAKRFSALVGISLENSVQTADAMLARGFKGARRRYSPYRFRAADCAALVFIIALFAAQLALMLSGTYDFEYTGALALENTDAATPVLWAALCLFPLAVDVWEDAKWRLLRSKI